MKKTYTTKDLAIIIPTKDRPDHVKRQLQSLVEQQCKLGRIIVHRKLARSLKLPRQKEQTDYREWFFLIQLSPEIEPKVTFDVPEMQFVPARTVDEANRYFKLVDSLLQRSTD